MRLLTSLFILTLIASAVAFFTKPSAKGVERHLQTLLFAQLGKSELNDSHAPLANAALIGCKLRPNDCYDLVRGQIDLTYDDRTLYARIDIAGFGRKGICYAAFTRIACPGGLQRD